MGSRKSVQKKELTLTAANIDALSQELMLLLETQTPGGSAYASDWPLRRD